MRPGQERASPESHILLEISKIGRIQAGEKLEESLCKGPGTGGWVGHWVNRWQPVRLNTDCKGEAQGGQDLEVLVESLLITRGTHQEVGRSGVGKALRVCDPLATWWRL